jgi:hypothetical protein
MTISKKDAGKSNMQFNTERIDCANLCPDDRREEFEYGAYCVANLASNSAFLQKSGKGQEASKIIVKLEQLEKSLDGLSAPKNCSKMVIH